MTFEWNWNGQVLRNTDQFVLRGIRDGQDIELARVNGSQRQIDINMRDYGNFETTWQWYLRIEGQDGTNSPDSIRENFFISLGKDDGPGVEE